MTHPATPPTHPTEPGPSWTPVEGAGAVEVLEENWLFRLRRERFRSRATGTEHDFYLLHLADAVEVIALTPDREVLLVRQFRAGSNRDSLEPPGGLVEPGEDPLVAGPRELLEETGYAGDPPKLLGVDWSNPSLMTSRITTILVTNARPVGDLKLDHGEELDLERVPAREIPLLIADGRIDHALAVNGLLRWLVSELPGPMHVAGNSRGRYWLQVLDLILFVAIVAVWLAIALQIEPSKLMNIGAVCFLLSPFLVMSMVWNLRRAWREPTLLSAASRRPGRRRSGRG